MIEKAGDEENAGQKGPPGQGQRAALISAPSSVDTSGIREALAGHNVSSFSIDQLDLPGESVLQLMREGMRRADLVVGVVDETPESASVIYELGYARALGKSTLVFVTRDVEVSTWVSTGVPYFRFDPEKPAGLEYGIAQVLRVPHHGTTEAATPSRRTRPLGPVADELLSDLRAAGEGIREDVLEHIIGRALRESGMNSVSEGGRENRRIDFAVWSDDWQPWVGNPFPIELRTNVRSISSLDSAVGQLAQALGTVTMPWGLLIYVRSTVDIQKELKVPNILAISAEEFLTQLRTMSIGDLIRRMRNERVHGRV